METITVKNVNELGPVAALIVERAAGSGVVAFYGEMGAGKTTLIREICSQLGVTDAVASPTFALVNHYNTAQGDPVYHFDFYRIDSPSEAFDLGYEEYFYGDGLCLVEWPEKIEQLLPDDTLKIEIKVTGPDSREIVVS